MHKRWRLFAILTVSVTLLWLGGRGIQAVRQARQEEASRLLLQAIEMGTVADVQNVLAHGANPNGTWYGIDPRHLLSFRANLWHLALQPHDPRSAQPVIFVAAILNEPDKVSLLLEHGADPNARTGYGDTTLIELAHQCYHEPLRPEQIEIISLLLAHGANSNLSGQNGQTALSVAVQQGSNTTVRLLIEHGANVQVKGGNDNTLLMSAVQEAGDSSPQSADIIALLLAHGANSNEKLTNGATVLSQACEWINPGVVSALLNAGAYPNVHSPANDMTPLEQSIRQGQTGIFKSLLAHGADANAYSKYDSSPLYMAAQYKRPDMAALLLAHGANPNFINEFEMRTPVLVIAAVRNDVKMVALLLSHGADVNLVDKEDGSTALVANVGNDLWGEYGTRHKMVDIRDALDLRAATKPVDLTVPKLLLAHGAKINTADWGGNTALALAVLGHKTSLVRMLLVHGADANVWIKDVPLKTLAVQRGYKDVMILLNNNPPKLLRLLHQTDAVPTPAGAGQPKAA